MLIYLIPKGKQFFFPSRVATSKNSQNKTNKQGANKQSAAIHRMKHEVKANN